MVCGPFPPYIVVGQFRVSARIARLLLKPCFALLSRTPKQCPDRPRVLLVDHSRDRSKQMACRTLRIGAGLQAALNYVAGEGCATYETAVIVAAAALNMRPDVAPVVRAFLDEARPPASRAMSTDWPT